MRYIVFLAVLIFFTACSPRYVVKTHYSNPTTQTGKVCIKKCEYKRDNCQKSCNNRYNTCLKKAQQKAQENFSFRLREYDMDMRDYYHEMDRYHLEFDRWEYRRNRLEHNYQNSSLDCARIKSIKFKKKSSTKEKKRVEVSCKKNHQRERELYRHTHQFRPTEPIRPTKPILSEEVAKFQKNCSRRCGCTKSYDRCFVSCGGKLSYEKICVVNKFLV